MDPATTVLFTDAGLPGIVIKAMHVTQLRTAVNALRAATGFSGATFTDSSLNGVIIKAAHISELRSALAVARSAIGLSLFSTDVPLNAGSTVIKGVHVSELRAGTKKKRRLFSTSEND